MKKKISGVITYILKGDDILLIYKKRGHGSGWFNGPGGKLERNESPLEAAIRETSEEIGLMPNNPELCGFIRFFDVYDEDWNVYIFRAYDFSGDIRESEEATPRWFKKWKIPYDTMWEDDKYWLPAVLDGKYFIATFHFKGDKMLKKDIVLYSKEEFNKKVEKLN